MPLLHDAEVVEEQPEQEILTERYVEHAVRFMRRNRLHPDIVAELQARLQTCREDIGDEATGVRGANVRPIGRVDNPKPLAHYDPDCPYIWAEYDTEECG